MILITGSVDLASQTVRNAITLHSVLSVQRDMFYTLTLVPLQQPILALSSALMVSTQMLRMNARNVSTIARHATITILAISAIQAPSRSRIPNSAIQDLVHLDTICRRQLARVVKRNVSLVALAQIVIVVLSAIHLQLVESATLSVGMEKEMTMKSVTMEILKMTMAVLVSAQ
jgi:hypothetical protein